jgi:hypothetical protein
MTVHVYVQMGMVLLSSPHHGPGLAYTAVGLRATGRMPHVSSATGCAASLTCTSPACNIYTRHRGTLQGVHAPHLNIDRNGSSGSRAERVADPPPTDGT